LHLAEGIKSVSSVPLIAVAKIHEPDLAEDVLKEGKADFIAIGRGIICDPEWPKKVQEGRVGEIRGCITCNQGCIDRLLAEAGSVSCIYNARAGRELQFPMGEAGHKKNVVIIGGGPAGMEAARTAALRGHTVHLFEETSELGGQALLASATPHKGEFAEVVRYLKHEIDRFKVNVHLNTRADAGTVEQLNPDTVIVATGAQPLVPDIPGVDRPNVVQAWDVISGKATPSGKVAVIGGGLVGCETAELLAEKGCQVVVFELLKDVVIDIGPSLRTVLLERLMNNPRIKIITGAEVKEIGENSVVVVREEGRQAIQGIDTVVLAAGATPRNEIVEDIKATGVAVHVIGDALEPRKAIDAIHQAFETAYAL
jgi:NADPH-dependent 2,4-dienoyl-CoA reductase/sulfur reductase-like enzyme